MLSQNPTVNGYCLASGRRGRRCGNRRGSERYLGSGPTLFALCDKPDTAQRVADWLGKNYLQNQEGFVHICQLDTAGARVLEN